MRQIAAERTKLTAVKPSVAKKRALSIKKDWKSLILLIPFFVCLYLTLWRPTINGFIYSLFKLQGYTPVKFVGFQNYIAVLRDTIFLTALANSLKYVFWSFVLGYLPPLIIAIIMNEMVRFKGLMRFSVYLPVMVPAMSASLIWYLLYNPTNIGALNIVLAKLGAPPFAWLENSTFVIPLIVMSLTWKAYGSTCLLYQATLQGVNQSLYEAAKIEGANAWQRIKVVQLPHLSGVMMLFAVNQVIGVFQIMEQPLAMTGGGPNNASITLSLQGYHYGFTYFQTEKALALGVVIFMILMVLTSFYFRLDKSKG